MLLLENQRPTKQIVQSGRATSFGCDQVPHRSTANQWPLPTNRKSAAALSMDGLLLLVVWTPPQLSAPTANDCEFAGAVRELRERCGSRRRATLRVQT
jgi:hypothetical protein